MPLSVVRMLVWSKRVASPTLQLKFHLNLPHSVRTALGVSSLSFTAQTTKFRVVRMASLRVGASSRKSPKLSLALSRNSSQIERAARFDALVPGATAFSIKTFAVPHTRCESGQKQRYITETLLVRLRIGRKGSEKCLCVECGSMRTLRSS